MNHETCTYRSLSDRPGWCIHEWNVAFKMPLPVSVAFPLQAIQYFNNYPIWWLKAGVHLDQTSFGTGRFRRWGVWAVGSSFSEEQVGSQGCRGCLILCKCLSNLEMGINGLWAKIWPFSWANDDSPMAGWHVFFKASGTSATVGLTSLRRASAEVWVVKRVLVSGPMVWANRTTRSNGCFRNKCQVFQCFNGKQVDLFKVRSVWRWHEPCKSTISIGGSHFDQSRLFLPLYPLHPQLMVHF